MGIRRYGHIIQGAMLALSVLLSSAPAAPTFQVYIDGATARDVGADQDTWVTSNSTFNLVLVGAYAGNTSGLRFGTLIVSVPQGQTGTISISDGQTQLTPLTTTRTTPFGDIPGANADVDLLTNIVGNDGYANKSPVLNLNNHYPYQNDVADFLYYDAADFDNVDTIHDYDAETGTIMEEDEGQEKAFTVSVTSFRWAHLDLGGYVDRESDNNSWEINPSGHDAAYFEEETLAIIPSPGSLLIAALGIALVGWVRLRNGL